MNFETKLFLNVSRALVFSFWAVFCLHFGVYSIERFLGQGFDFDLFYSISNLLKFGLQADIYTNTELSPPYVYSPPVAVFFTPLSWLPFEISKGLFAVFKVILLFLLPFQFVDIISALKGRLQGVNYLKFFILACLSVAAFRPAFFEDMIVGNINIILLSFTLQILQLWLRKKAILASFFLSIACAFKPQLALLFLPMLTRLPRMVVYGGCYSLFVLVFIGIIGFGPEQLFEHFLTWRDIISKPLARWHDVNNMSFGPFIRRQVQADHLSQVMVIQNVSFLNLPGLMAHRVVMLFLIPLSLLFIFGIYRSKKIRAHFADFVDLNKQRMTDHYFIIEFSLALVFVNLLSPVAWLTHFVFGAFIVFAAICSHKTLNGGWYFLRSALLLLVGSVVMLPFYSGFSPILKDYSRAYALPNLAYLICGTLFFVVIFKLQGKEKYGI